MKRIASNLWAATKRHSVFYICFVSYLFVLLFSLLFNVYNYTAYIAELRAQKDLYDQVMFQQFDEMINSELNKVDSLLLNVLTDTDILRSVSSDDLVSSHQLSKTLRTSILMRNYANDVAGMYIYFDNNDAIVMEGSYYQAQDFYRRFVDQEKMSYEDWHHRQTQLFYRQYEPSYSGDPNEFVLYHTVYGVYGRKALVAITFSLEDIFRIFQLPLQKLSVRMQFPAFLVRGIDSRPQLIDGILIHLRLQHHMEIVLIQCQNICQQGIIMIEIYLCNGNGPRRGITRKSELKLFNLCHPGQLYHIIALALRIRPSLHGYSGHISRHPVFIPIADLNIADPRILR